MSIIGSKFNILCFYIMKILSSTIDIWMKTYLISENNCNTVIYNNHFVLQEYETIMIDLHIVLVTLHMRLTISTEQHKEDW